MIHTKDLMLGNWVVCRVGGKYSDKRSIPMKVVALFDDCAYLDFDGNDGDVWEEYDKDLFGIEITDELLVKIGFEKREYKRHGGKRCEYVKDNAVSVSFSIGGGCVVGVGLTFKGGVTYLHQLQNAYHLLTGKQLEIKL